MTKATKYSTMLLALIIVSSLILTIELFANNKKKLEYTVMITQIVNNPALNLNRQGILAAINDLNTEQLDLKIIYEHADGNLIKAEQIAYDFIKKKPDLIVAISTPSLQALLKARQDSSTQIPIIFSGVSSVATYQAAQQLAGVTDKPDTGILLERIRTLLNPEKIGIIYNANEDNAATLVAEIKSLVLDNEALVPAIIDDKFSVAEATYSLVKQVDCIIVPLDNTVNSDLASLTHIANHYDVPVFSFDPQNVEKDVLLSIGYNQYDIGYLAGSQIIDYIYGKPIDLLEIITPKDLTETKNASLFNKLFSSSAKK